MVSSWIYSIIGLSIILCATGITIVPDGETCSDCMTLSDIITNPQLYLTSNTILNFRQGTHIINRTTPVIINGVSNLTLEDEEEPVMEDGSHWTIKQSKVIIKCLNSTGGFIFNQSSVDIIGITFTNCGLPVDRGYIQSRYAPYQNGLFSSAYNFSIYSYLWSTLYFIDSPHVGLFRVSVQNCSGSCLYFLNTHHIQMSTVYIAHGSPDESRNCCDTDIIQRPDCVGGNVIFFYLNSPRCDIDSVDNYQVVVGNSSFSFGAGPLDSKAIMAGITFVNMKNVLVTAMFESTILYGNSGGNFASLSIMSRLFFHNVSSLRANVYACPSNELDISFKISVSNELLCRVNLSKTSTIVNINESIFSENTAIDAAGLNIDTSYVVVVSPYEAEISFKVANTQITNNKASLASCIGSGSPVNFLASASLFLSNVTIIGNTVYRPDSSPYLGIPPCCIVLINTEIAMFEDVVIKDHALAGIFSITSNLMFSGSTIISNNTGIDKGGALILRDNSKIILLPNTTVSFIDNRAQFGAALYIYQPDVQAFIYQNFQLCIYQITEDPNIANSRFYFSDNKASITGNIVYGGYVSNCLLFYNTSVTPSLEFFPFIFDYNTSSPLFDISSDAERLCFCENDLPRCDLSMTTIGPVYPGQLVNVSVIPVGQDLGLTIGKIDVYSTFFNFTYNDTIRTYNATCVNVLLPVQINGQDKRLSSYDLSTMDMAIDFSLQVDSQLIIENYLPLRASVTIQPCPPGFRVNASFACECVELVHSLPNVTCNIVNNTISRSDNAWIGYDESINDTIVSSSCPFDYCKHGLVTFNILETHLQCAYNRSGILCGECIEGYSILLGSNECGHCPNNNYLSLLIVFSIAGILLVVLLITLNLTVSVGTINGLIFYANIVKINEDIFFPSNSSKPLILRQFISFINLDFGLKACFVNGLTAYIKAWLQFVFPLYIWFIMIVIMLLSRRFTKISNLIGNNAVKVFATLLLLSYTKIIRAIGITLASEYVYCDNDGHYVWTYDGNIPYGSTKHAILITFSILLLVCLVLPYTLLLVGLPVVDRFFSLIRCRKYFLWLKPFTDAYSGPFRQYHTFWVGLLIIARILLTIAKTIITERAIYLLLTAFLVMLLLAFGLDFQRPYQKIALNVLESWFFINLFGLSILSLKSDETAKMSAIISVSLVLGTFVGLIIYHIYWLYLTSIFEKMNIKKRLNESEPLINPCNGNKSDQTVAENGGILPGSDNNCAKHRYRYASSNVILSANTRPVDFSRYRDSILDHLDS